MKITRAGVDRSSSYQPEEITAISVRLAAWDGEVGQGSVPCPDPAGNQEPVEGQQLLLEVGATTIVDGFIGAVQSARGSPTIGVRRVHIATLGDDNALLQGHATPAWARPAESPAARWAAFVSDFLPGSIDTTWLLTTHESGVTLPKTTYRSDSLFDDLLADTVRPTGKTVYIEGRRFHWHLPTEGQTCSIVIHDTNTPTSTSFRPLSAQRSKDGMDLRNKVYARNDAGIVVSASDATSITAHDAAGLKHQGYSEYGADSAADMTRDIGVTIAERKDERVTWTYDIGPLTPAQAAALIPGSQMTVTVGLHGLSASVKRIASVVLAYRHPNQFIATIELGYPKRFRRKPTKTSAGDTSGSATGSGGSSGGRAGSCGCPPWDFGVCTPSRETFTRTASGGWGPSEFTGSDWNVLVNGSVLSVNGSEARMQPSGTNAVPGFTQLENGPSLPGYPIHIRFKAKFLTVGGEVDVILSQPSGYIGAAGSVQLALTETPGGSPPFAFYAEIHGDGVGTAAATTNPFGATDPLGQWIWVEAIISATDLQFRVWLDGGSVPAYTTYTAAGPLTIPNTLIWTARTNVIGGGTQTADIRLDIIEILCEDPPNGTYIPDEFVAIGDGLRSTFTFQRAYIAETPHVEVDNIHHLVTETNPATGEFDLGFVPIAGEEVRGSYDASVP